MMEGDSQEALQREIGPFVALWPGELLARINRDPQNDHPHRKAQPDHGDGRNISQGNLGSDKGYTPDNHGEEGFQRRDEFGFWHTRIIC